MSGSIISYIEKVAHKTHKTHKIQKKKTYCSNSQYLNYVKQEGQPQSFTFMVHILILLVTIKYSEVVVSLYLHIQNKSNN